MPCCLVKPSATLSMRSSDDESPFFLLDFFFFFLSGDRLFLMSACSVAYSIYLYLSLSCCMRASSSASCSSCMIIIWSSASISSISSCVYLSTLPFSGDTAPSLSASSASFEASAGLSAAFSASLLESPSIKAWMLLSRSPLH